MRRRIVMVVGVALVMALAMVASMSPALAEVTLNKGEVISTEIKLVPPGAARGFWVSNFVRGIG